MHYVFELEEPSDRLSSGLKLSGRSATQYGGRLFRCVRIFLAMDSGIGEKEAKPTRAIITVRLIRSFEYRNIKYVVFKDVLLEQAVQHFMNFVISGR